MTLPSTYQEVEYIESSGTQYIDTGKTVSGDVKIDYTYMPKEAVSSSTSGGTLVFMDNDRRSNGFGSGNTYTYYGGNTSNNEGYTVGTLQQDVLCHDIIAKSGCSRTLNGNTVSYIPSSSYPSPTGNLKLFVSQRAGSIIGYWKTRMYSFKRYDSGALTQDMIPCYRKSDDEIGLYDLVNDIFYTNQGTGTFTKGPNVVIPYKLHGAIQTFHYQPQIDPPVPQLIEYNYDFTDGTWTNASLITDGWGAIGKQENTPWGSTSYGMTMMSGILGCYNTSTDKGCSTWRKIEVPSWVTHLSLKAKGQKEGSWGGVYINIYDPIGNKTIIGMGASYNNSKNWYHINGTDVKTGSDSYVIIGEGEVDCSTGAWSCTINNGGSASGTTSSFTLPSELYINPSISKGFYQTPTGIYYIELKMR